MTDVTVAGPPATVVITPTTEPQVTITAALASQVQVTKAGDVIAASPNVNASVIGTAIGTTGVTWSTTVSAGVVTLNIIVDNSSGTAVSIEMYGQKLTYPS